MFVYQPEEEFRALPDGRDLRICRYDRAGRWFTIAKRRYFGCGDLTRRHLKSYPDGDGCSADLFTSLHSDYVLRIYRKIPEFDEFDCGDHSFVYFILSGRQQADQLFETVRSRLSALEYADNSALQVPYVIRRGLSDSSLDAFAVYESV